MPRDIIPQPRWYALRCAPSSARLIQVRIAQRAPDIDLYIPVEERRAHRGGIERRWQTPLIPGYIFARLWLEAGGWQILIEQRGVHGFLKAGDAVAVISDRDIAAIRAKENPRGVIPSPSARTIFGKGERVLIQSGPFAGHQGKIDRTGTKQIDRVNWRGDVTREPIAVARVLVSIMGTEAPTEIEEQDLERV